MNQEKVGQLIKEIRNKSGLSQEKFGEKYNVTYQAVSKWETGKNLPDIAILKQICIDYNIDINELLEGKKTKKKTYLILIIIISIILILSLIFLFRFKANDDFEFKTISTTCNDFNLYGSIAYNKNKTSIYISNITYCGKEDNEIYKEIKCILYENDNNTKKEINRVQTKEETNMTDFLKKVNFNVEHYSKSCQMYKDNGLFLEIEAVDKNNQTHKYEIPLKFTEKCL